MQTQVLTLVMESRGIAPQVRSLANSCYWSKLYRAGQYFLDLSCKSNDASHVIRGHLFAESGYEVVKGKINLNQLNDAPIQANLSNFGEFKLDVLESGCYELEVSLEGQSLKIPQFVID